MFPYEMEPFVDGFFVEENYFAGAQSLAAADWAGFTRKAGKAADDNPHTARDGLCVVPDQRLNS
ncbi:hypothetical protein A7X67_02110 [Clostridium sp. W14A]|nr:hypothetical protein A7X67_02110 [Clostridium sp. W14A]